MLTLQRTRRLAVVREAFRARQRKRRMLLVFINRLLEERSKKKARRKRRAWAWPRNQNWFELLLREPSLDSCWQEHFRVKRQTFEFLCDLLRTDLQRQDTRMRKATCVEKKILVGLWRLATGESFEKCGERFALGKSTCKTAFKSFEEGLLKRKDSFIKFPLTSEEIKDKINSFEELYGIPQIVGAIASHHIEMHTPSDNQEDYLDHKQRYSSILQVIADSDFRFIYVAPGFPGSFSDANVLKLSGFHEQAKSQQILAAPTRKLSGIDIRPLIVGGKGFSLSSWMVKPYAAEELDNLTPEQRKFNTKLCACRSVAKRALDLLKARFGLVVKKTEQKVDSLSKTLTAACVLHNLCIDRGDIYPIKDISEDNLEEDSDSEEGIEGTENGEAIRKLLRDYVCENI